MGKGARYVLTPEIQHQVCAFIRAGAFVHVAFEAAGVPWEVGQRWLESGCPLERRRGWKPHERYTPLWSAVRQAQAQARLKAEVATFADDPSLWLRSGPGRDRPNDPGWGVPVKVQSNTVNQQINVLTSPAMTELFGAILQVLAPFPEARAAVAEALAGVGEGNPPRPRPTPGAGEGALLPGPEEGEE